MSSYKRKKYNDTIIDIGIMLLLCLSLMAPAYEEIFEPTKKDRCIRYLSMNHLDGHYDLSTAHCYKYDPYDSIALGRSTIIPEKEYRK